MKLHVLCVFMGLGLVFADRVLHEERSAPMGVQKRGQSYSECIETYLSEANNALQDEDDVTKSAVNEATSYIRGCLAAYTDEEADLREQSMKTCIDQADSNLKQALMDGGKSQDEVSRVAATFKQYQEMALSDDPAIGCNDNA